jgi:hypothetical protein
MLSRYSGYAFTTTASPKGLSLFMRLLPLLLYRLERAACWLVSSCIGLLYRRLILLDKFQNYLAEGCKKGTRENRLTAIFPKSSRSSRNIRVALSSVFAPYHRHLQEVVIQTHKSA